MQDPMAPQTSMEQELLQRESAPAVSEVDPAITRALGLLQDDERPTFKVTLVDPDPVKFPIFRIKPDTIGLNDRRKQEIFINRSAVKDDQMLAAIIAHEQEHVKRYGQPDEHDERPAYQRQYDVLKRAGYKDKNYLKALLERAKDRTEAKDRK
jgi:hypothetical protein